MDKTMTQVKFTIEADIAAAFKARCSSEGVSMASEARRLMAISRPRRSMETRASTRPLRRKTVKEAIGLLLAVLEAEAEYRDRIPEQFSERSDAANNACEQLEEAIAKLDEAFQQ
jgi:hypothetical protein